MKAKLPWRGTPNQNKAMMEEIKKQILENERKYETDYDAMVLYALFVSFGFGKKRLRRFYDTFKTEHQKLIDYYQMDSQDGGWLCSHKLKEIGIDVEQWANERSLNYEIRNK